MRAEPCSPRPSLANRIRSGTALLLFSSVLWISLHEDGAAQTRDPGFSIEQILGAPFPYGLVAAKRTDRIAWIENDRGMRNVYTAAAPDFTPVRLTGRVEDDGVDLGPLHLSDDGSVVLFIQGHEENGDGWVANPSSNPLGGRREIWAASTTGLRQPWRIVAAPNMTPSPDGRWVLWVRDGQVFRAPVDPGLTADGDLDQLPPLFRDLGSNSNPAWSPDGKKIAFVTSRRDQRRPFPNQGQAPTHSFIGVYDLDSRIISYMGPSVDRDTSPVWSPDGRSIAFLRRPGLPFGHFATAPRDLPRDQIPEGFLEARFAGGSTLAIWIADVESGDAHPLWHNQPGDSLFAEVSSVEWSGEHILFEAEPDGWNHWFSVSVDNPRPEPVLLTPGRGEVEHVSVSWDGRTLYFTSNVSDLDGRDLWRVPTGGGPADQLTRGSGIETFPAVLPSSGQIALLQSGPSQPLSVGLLPAGGGQTRLIGPVLPSDFPTSLHVQPEVVVIRAADGVEAHSQLFLPPDLRPGERRPALLFIHGGPAMQTVLGYHYQGSHGFYHLTYAMSQYFANKGYIVMSVNYRAGRGYGRAFRLAPERRDQGNSEYRDVLAAGLWLRDRPDVDPERLGVWGLSYGGWLAGQALSRNSDLFKAGMIFAGVQMRSASLDPDDLAYQSSPAYNIRRWTSPVLIIHGDDDRNVEFSQTVGLVQLLRAHDVPHELIVYPNDTHYYQIFSRWIRAFRAVDDFFDRTLIRKEGVRTTSYGGE